VVLLRDISLRYSAAAKTKRRTEVRLFAIDPDGAGEAIRTPDPNLGKVMLYP
jgi:hypothetical protein